MLKKKSSQVISLYLAMVIGLSAGFGISIINTRLLGPQSYGNLKFIQTLFNFAISVSSFGFFTSGSRMIAKEKDTNRVRAIFGSLILFTIVVSSILVIFLFIFSFFDGSFFNGDLGHVIIIFSPFIFFYMLRTCLEDILQGANRIYELSIFSILPSLIYLFSAIAFNYCFPLTLKPALLLHFLALGISLMVHFRLLKPLFQNIKESFRAIYFENKVYGFHVFIGSCVGVASMHIGGLSIAYFVDIKSVGFFSLALTITAPLVMIPGLVGKVFFKDFTSMDKIPLKATIITFIISISALFVFLLICKQLVIILYSSEYSAVAPLAYIVSIGRVLHGSGDYINRFLGAHGKGKLLRNSALLVGVSNIIGFTVLGSLFGVTGAAITTLVAGFIYFLSMYLFYRNFRKSIHAYN